MSGEKSIPLLWCGLYWFKSGKYRKRFRVTKMAAITAAQFSYERACCNSVKPNL